MDLIIVRVIEVVDGKFLVIGSNHAAPSDGASYFVWNVAGADESWGRTFRNARSMHNGEEFFLDVEAAATT